MSEGTPEYRATEGPAMPAGTDRQDQLDDVASAAFDSLIESARHLREHICQEPMHVDVSAEFLDDAEEFADAFEAFEQAHDAAEEAAEAARVEAHGDAESGEPDAPIATTSLRDEQWAAWERGFVAGTRTQHKATIEFAQGRGWVSVSSAIQTAPIVPLPARDQSLAIAYYASLPDPSASEGDTDARS